VTRPRFPEVDAPILPQVIEFLARHALEDRAPAIEDLALELGDGDGDAVSTLDDRFELLRERLGLDPLDSVVLALIACSDVSPELGLVLAAPGARRTTPRTLARLLAHAGYAEGGVYRALDSHGTLRRAGAVRMLAAGDDIPVVDGQVACATAVATFLLAADVDDPSCAGRLRRIDAPALPLGREEVVARLRQLIALSDGPTPFLHGPDAELLLAAAGGAGVLLVGALELADPLLRLDAAIAATLEQRVLLVDQLSAIETREAGQLAGWLADLPRPLLLGQGPRDMGALDGLAVTEIRVPPPSHGERIAAWREGLGEIAGLSEVAALHRLPIARIADSIRDVAATVATAGIAPVAADVADAARRASAARTSAKRAATRAALSRGTITTPS